MACQRPIAWFRPGNGAWLIELTKVLERPDETVAMTMPHVHWPTVKEAAEPRLVRAPFEPFRPAAYRLALPSVFEPLEEELPLASAYRCDTERDGVPLNQPTNEYSEHDVVRPFFLQRAEVVKVQKL